MTTEFRAVPDMHGPVSSTVAGTVKFKIPDTLAHHLDDLLAAAVPCVSPALTIRSEASSKYYLAIPCVMAKRLIAGRQGNRKNARQSAKESESFERSLPSNANS